LFEMSREVQEVQAFLLELPAVVLLS